MKHFTDPLFSHATACGGHGPKTTNIYQVGCLACRKDPIFWWAWRAAIGERYPSLPGDLPRNDPPHYGMATP